MKIAIITPGILPIKNKFWGAVERYSYNLMLYFNRMGHECDIVFSDDKKLDEGYYDIVHVYMENQARDLHRRGIKYFFTPCDHHICIYGQNSELYKNHVYVIDNSILTIAIGEFLIPFLGNKENMIYIPVGVDRNLYKFKIRNIKNREVKLLCLANNGIIGDQTEDRKGFLPAIEAAKALNLPITIAGPTNSNKVFFNHHKPDYNKLNLIYDLEEEELIPLFHDHDIFLHLSYIETGHPNMTLVETLSTGLPVVGVYWGGQNLKSIVKTSRNPQSIVEGINKVIQDYAAYNLSADNDAKLFDWNVVGYELLKLYSNYINNHYKITKFETNSVSVFKQNLDFIYNSDYVTSNNRGKINKIPEFILNFLDGAFLELKNHPDGDYFVKFIDEDTEELIYQSPIKNGFFTKTLYLYFIRYRIEVYQNNHLVMKHSYNAENKKVLVYFESSSLGDTIAWMPYVDLFQKQHKCELIVSSFYNELFEKEYNNLKFVKPGTVVGELYAAYKLGIFDVKDKKIHRNDPRLVPLQQCAADILGIDFKEVKPKIYTDNNRPIEEKYVCIGTESTSQAKLWNNFHGWKDTVKYLNHLGFKVVSLTSKDHAKLDDVIHVTGDLKEKCKYLQHCEFFIGLGSGLSWMAWALNKKVILISGFSHEWCEFYTPYRIINKDVCHGCFNDDKYEFFDKSWLWCPAKKDFECTKNISSRAVIEMIDKIVN